MMLLAIYILLFFLGAAIGSFLNVLITRSIEGKEWVGGRSKCDRCGKVLAWYDMVPVLSYIFYRGKSRCCKKRLSMQHPIVESMLGILFVWWLAVGTLFFQLVTRPYAIVQPIYWLLTGILLLGIVIADLYYGLVPVGFVIIGVVVNILYRLILMSGGQYLLHDFWLSILAAIGAAGFFQLLRLITKGRGMGDGDVILAIWMGLILGWPRILVGVLSSFVIGASVSVILIVSGKTTMKSTIPFGPFMVMGIFVALTMGSKLLPYWGL